MIKKSTYIRKFTAKQRQQLETVAQNENLKKVPEILFFVLEQYHEQIKDIARLKRIIQIKQNKIDRLQGVDKT